MIIGISWVKITSCRENTTSWCTKTEFRTRTFRFWELNLSYYNLTMVRATTTQNKRSMAARAGRAARSSVFVSSSLSCRQNIRVVILIQRQRVSTRETRTPRLFRRTHSRIFRISWMTQGASQACSVNMSCWKMAPSWTSRTRTGPRGTASSLRTVRYSRWAHRKHRWSGRHPPVWVAHYTRKTTNTFSSFKSGSTKNLWDSWKIGWSRGTTSTWPQICGTNNSKINRITMATWIITRAKTNKFSKTSR